MYFNYMWLVNKDIIQLPDYKLKKLYPCIVPLTTGENQNYFLVGKGNAPFYVHVLHQISCIKRADVQILVEYAPTNCKDKQ